MDLMTKVRSLALETGLANPDLSRDYPLMTDYGTAEESIIRFAAAISELAADEVFRADMREWSAKEVAKWTF